MSDMSRMMGYGDDEEKMKTKDHNIYWILGIICMVVGLISVTFSELLAILLIGGGFGLFIKAAIERNRVTK